MDKSKAERPLGIVSALPEEMGGLGLALDKGDVVEVAGYHFHHGRVDGHPVVLAEAGCGKVATAIVASLLADRFGCAGLVFSGVAGGLDPALAIGDIVIADELIQHDYGAVTGGRLKPYHPGLAPIGARDGARFLPPRPRVAPRHRREHRGLQLAAFGCRRAARSRAAGAGSCRAISSSIAPRPGIGCIRISAARRWRWKAARSPR